MEISEKNNHKIELTYKFVRNAKTSLYKDFTYVMNFGSNYLGLIFFGSDLVEVR